MKNNKKNLFEASVKKIRKSVIDTIYNAKKGHLGGALSSIDLLYYLYSNKIVEVFINKNKYTKNSLILSKGHSSLGLLAVINYVKKNKYLKLLNTFNQNGSLSGNNCSELVPGFEFHTGSLGHGVGLGCGVALAKYFQKTTGHTIVLISDGEIHEGSIMEGILFADQHNLNLTVIIDNNGQICENFTDNVVSVKKALRFFKKEFQCIEINGNKFTDLKKISNFLKKKGFKIIISNTVKGRGISFMEKKIKWHHSIPGKEDYENAIKELK
tara:strand:+ start:2579 stop:3385 length:807 start_codon:yes stop_codon:yes gene_type:complete